MTSTEIAVVGGGLVGLTAALLLSDAGFSVVIIDPVTALPVRDDPYDLRTYALTSTSRQIFSNLGVWSALDHGRIAPFSDMQVWDGARGGELTFPADLIPGTLALGYIVEHSNLLNAVQQVVQAQSRISGLGGQVTAITEGRESSTIHLGGRELRAKLILGCDGGDSPLRRLCGIACVEHDYAQHAVVANVTTVIEHANVARQRFLAEGPLAFLPLPPADLSSVVWTMSAEYAAWVQRCSDDEFCAALSAAFENRLGAVTATSRRLIFPLRRRHAADYSRGRVALLGDAAHVIHPLAGQGLNLGLRDAVTIAELVGAAPRASLNHPQTLLRRYARTRRGENLAMLLLTDQLNRIFAVRAPWFTWLRHTGLVGLNHLQGIKAELVAHAMGRRGELPPSVRDL
ncbi:MAG: 2-octaprenyl-3-methyl-6-methoxy-1,4-benzoquinol hydroxylase [Gammaproteobacteria bacterium]|nr:2-octaprenyl-3-methyl-6-methoxy-1,4-benzoquinol hydroxylase [Gammaproteobacteria bacterium]